MSRASVWLRTGAVTTNAPAPFSNRSSRTRTPTSTAVLYEALAEMGAWPAREFSERRFVWLAEVSGRHETAPRAAFFAWLRRLLREELGR